MYMKSRISYRSLAAKWLVFFIILSCYPVGTMTGFAAQPASGTVSVDPVPGLQNGQRSDFIMGADVSELYELEKAGRKFYDTDGTEMSAMQVLKKHGVNYIRLRIWNDPTDAFGQPIGGGNNDLARDIAMAKQAKALGIKLLLDFHYSDFWVDPGKQNKPKAWANHSGTVLQEDVYRYTYDVLTAMEAEGVLPEMVQIGNEINGGLLWPDGDSAEKAAPFLQKASAAVRAVDPDIQIMIHIAGNSSGSTGTFTWNLDTWTTGGTAVDFDLIGISDYPFWHGTTEQNAVIMNTLASRYGKPVIVAETAYAWTLEPGDETINNFDQSSAYTAGYTPTPQGQAAAIRDVINNLANVPGNQGLGLFYWGADWLPGNDTGWIAGQGSGWENQALFDYTGKALPSIDVFNLVRGTAAAPAPVFVAADPYYGTMEAGGVLSLPSSVQGQYSDGHYKPAAVSAWDTSAVNTAEPGVYTAYGTVGSETRAASAVITVHSAQPPNLLTNPGLESGSAGWTVSSPSIGAPQGAGSTPRSGTSAIHYWSDSAFNDATVSQTLNVANATYTFSAWVDGDALSDAAVPYLYAVGYDASDPSAMMKIDAVPAGWNNFKPYSLQVPVTSGHVTVGVNLNGAAGAWGDVDDFYFGLPTSTDAQTQAQPVTASIGDAALPAEAALPVPSKVTLSSGTEGAVIYYTTDGSEPGYASNTSTTLVYTGPVAIAANTVLKAMASKPGYTNSPASTFSLKTDGSAEGLIPDGGFEREGQLGAWTLTGAAAGSIQDSSVFDAIREIGDGKVYAGTGYFDYWSKDAYAFTLSQKVNGLPNGFYTLTAHSAGKSNMVIDDAGRAANDPGVAELKLRVETPSGGASANIINQGQTGADWHNIWGGFSIPGIRVTDGTVTVAFTASASADYWGYLDNITLVKTGDLPDTTPPGEVTGTAVAEGDGQLALSWTDPGDSDLEKIIIEQMDGTVADAVYAAKGAEHAVISGLTNGTSYTFKLSTVDLTGNRSAGIPITGTPAKASDDNNGNDDDDGDDDNNNNNNHDDGSEGQEPSGFPSPWAAAPAYSVGKGMIKVQPVIDANGDAVIQLRAADMEAAMLDSSVQTLTIEIANLDNAREVKVDIPYQPILAAGDDAIDTIKVDMGFTTLSFLTSLFAGKEGTAGSSLQLTVAKVGKDSLPAAVQERIGDHAVYDFSLTLDGQPITGFNGNEMQIAIAYKLMTGENPNKIIVYYSMMRVI